MKKLERLIDVAIIPLAISIVLGLHAAEWWVDRRNVGPDLVPCSEWSHILFGMMCFADGNCIPIGKGTGYAIVPVKIGMVYRESCQ